MNQIRFLVSIYAEYLNKHTAGSLCTSPPSSKLLFVCAGHVEVLIANATFNVENTMFVEQEG